MITLDLSSRTGRAECDQCGKVDTFQLAGGHASCRVGEYTFFGPAGWRHVSASRRGPDPLDFCSFACHDRALHVGCTYPCCVPPPGAVPFRIAVK